jgi:hypothetical protein
VFSANVAGSCGLHRHHFLLYFEQLMVAECRISGFNALAASLTGGAR